MRRSGWRASDDSVPIHSLGRRVILQNDPTMMKTASVVAKLTVEALEATFASFELDALVELMADTRPRASTAGPRLYSASLGYTSRPLRGVLTVVAPREVWTRILCVGFGGDAVPPPSESSLCDVAAEFANLALGKLKLRLATYGVDVRLATPSTACGIDLVVGNANTRDVGDVRVVLDAGSMTTSGAFAEDGLVLTEPSEALPIPQDGELLLL